MIFFENHGLTVKAGFAAVGVVIAALGLAPALGSCTPSATSSPPPSPSSSSASPALVVPPIDASAAAAPSSTQAATAGAHVFHYDLVLTGFEANATTKLSMDVSDASEASVTFGKNVLIAAGARSDVGSSLKARVTMQGETPLLEVDGSVSMPDGVGKVRRVPMKSSGSVATPLGTSTVVVDTTQDGKQYRLNATPTAIASLGAEVANATGSTFVVDVAVSQAFVFSTNTGGGGGGKTTPLTLTISGDTPAVAKQGENVPLSASDGGVGVARQDVGTRVKAVGHPRANGLALDFDLELSALEAGGKTPAGTIRKIVTRGPVNAPFDKATTAFIGEESGHRYEVRVTPHRAK